MVFDRAHMNDLRARLEASLSTTYRLERELGSGGMAVVYLAHDLRHKRRVALKVLRPEISAVMGPERFLREIETLANLTHPHILPLHDSGEADGLLFYVMPYVEGESLRDRLLREKQLPLDDALRIAREVADALSHAHGRGVIHRDIKPANILLSGGHALVADFGIAAAIDIAGGSRLTETGIAMGTPAYMSPEQTLGERTIDARADIYALGCVLYEMLAGEPPFTGPTAQVVMARRLHEPVPSLRRVRELVPDIVEQTITKALARLPADRFATAERFVEALTQDRTPPVVHDLAVGISRLVARQNDTAQSGRRRWKQVTVVVGVVAAVALLGILVRQLTGEDPSANRVAVARFVNLTNLESLDVLGAVLADHVTNGLTRTDLVDVAPTARVMGAAGAMSTNQIAFDARAFGRETAAGLIVHGSYSLRGDSLAIQPQLFDVKADRQLPVDLVVVPARDQQAAIQEVLERIKIALASRVHPMLAQSAPLTDLPGSMEAYRAYMAGFESYFAGDDSHAREQFYRAVELDSTFVSSLTWAAISEWSLTFNVPKVDSLLQLVERRRSELLPFDLASLDYLRAWVDGNVEAAQVAARRRADIGGPFWNVFAVQGALRLNRVDEAYDRIREKFKGPLSRKNPVAWLYLAVVLHIRGEHERELREVRNGIAQAGNPDRLLGAEIRALAALGEVDTLRGRLETAKSRGVVESGVLLNTAASQLRAHDFAAAADTIGRLALQWHRQAVIDSPTWRARFNLAVALFDLKDAEADTIFAALVREGLPLPYAEEHFQGLDAAALGYLGVSAAMRGDTARAEHIIAQLSNLRRPYLLGANVHWQARIAAQLGQCTRAVQLQRDALKNGSSYQTGNYLPLHELPQFAKLDCAAYREFIKPKK